MASGQASLRPRVGGRHDASAMEPSCGPMPATTVGRQGGLCRDRGVPSARHPSL